MAVLRVRTMPDPVLVRKAVKVGNIDAQMQRLIDDMLETMYAYEGVGLAANQVGVLQRIVVIHVPEEEEPRVLINPEIVKEEDEREMEEGCLSLPGWRGTTLRKFVVRAKALDRNGKPVKVRGEGLLAQALQHEIDHTNGILYTSRLVSKDQYWKLPPKEQQAAEDAEKGADEEQARAEAAAT